MAGLNHPQEINDEQLEELNPECRELVISLPRERGWRTPNLYLFQGFWCQPKEIQAILSIQNHYKAEDSDLILATIPKSGTTWLKALAFSIVNRHRFVHTGDDHHHPLLAHNPHELVPFLEYKLFAENQIPDMMSSSDFPRPRLLATHMPIVALPESVRESGCRIVYMVRNPFDTFVSIWHYLIKLRPASMGPFSFEEAFDMYCRGVVGFGPYWDHMLGYWKESVGNPNKVLFLKYEDVKANTGAEVKKLGEFLGFPFSRGEEEEGVVQGIVKMCSFEEMKELEVNKNGRGAIADFENKNLFRKAEVGDWVNHITDPLMVGRLTKLMEEKLAGTNLSFNLF